MDINKMEAKRDIKGLIKALKNKDATVRDLAAVALGKIGEPAIKPLIQAIRDAENSNDIILEKVQVALGLIGEPAVEPLIQALKDENIILGCKAGLALGVMAHYLGKDERAIEPLIQALNNNVKDSFGLVRVGAAFALGEIRDTRAIEPLIEALKYQFGSGDVAKALGKIGDAKAVEPLIKALRHENVYVRPDVATALGMIGDRKAIEPLYKALEDEHFMDAREAIKEALKKLGAWLG